jgi:hypothetical protein
MQHFVPFVSQFLAKLCVAGIVLLPIAYREWCGYPAYFWYVLCTIQFDRTRACIRATKNSPKNHGDFLQKDSFCNDFSVYSIKRYCAVVFRLL